MMSKKVATQNKHQCPNEDGCGIKTARLQIQDFMVEVKILRDQQTV